MFNVLRLALLLLPNTLGAPAPNPLGPPAPDPCASFQALTPPMPSCRGATCVARVHFFPSAPELQVRSSHVKDGQAETPYACRPCLDCQASVTVRVDPSANGSTATVWEWGHVPTPEEQEEMGGIPYADLGAPGSSMRRTLTGPCSGLIPVGPGSSILTIDLDTPTGRTIVTVWLACFC
jgi:hypothetical protein